MAENNMTDLVKGHRNRVREKYAKLASFDSFEPYEILELLLFYALPRKDTKPIAKNLISTFGSLKGVFDADINTLCKQPGIGLSTAVFLHSFRQTLYYLSDARADEIKGAADMGAFAVSLTRDKLNEEFYVVTLNSKQEITNHKRLASGRHSSAIVSVRDVIDFALDNNAAAITLIHNHPNKMLVPSKEDLEITHEIFQVAKSLDIKLSDHIITDGEGFTSLATTKQLERK